MMAYIINLVICLGVILFQSTILSNLLVFNHIYDLLIPYILYLGLYRSMSEGLPSLVFLGFVMDSISGGPFGLYITIYFWLFICIRSIIQYLHAGSLVLLPFVVCLGILVEYFVFFTIAAIVDSNWAFSKINVNNLISQMIWAVLTGPFIIMFFRYLQSNLSGWLDMRAAERS